MSKGTTVKNLKQTCKILQVVVALISTGMAAAQSVNESLNVPPELLQRVNSIETFIKRFNFQEDLNGNALQEMTPTEENVAKRNKYILTLFDYDKLNHTDSSGREKIFEFLNEVNNTHHQARLDFYDQGWYAEVHMDVLYKKKPEQLTLILINEQSQPRVSHWAIRGVKADFLNIYKNRQGVDSAQIIPPNSHGTDFIGIPQQFANHGMIKNYFSTSFKPDILSIFMYASENNEIEFKVCKQISYHFLQINGWIIKVREVLRSTTNSGWLVAEIQRADSEKKNFYESTVLNLQNP